MRESDCGLIDRKIKHIFCARNTDLGDLRQRAQSSRSSYLIGSRETRLPGNPWNWPPCKGRTGSTTPDCSNRLGASLRQKLRQTTGGNSPVRSPRRHQCQSGLCACQPFNRIDDHVAEFRMIKLHRNVVAEIGLFARRAAEMMHATHFLKVAHGRSFGPPASSFNR